MRMDGWMDISRLYGAEATGMAMGQDKGTRQDEARQGKAERNATQRHANISRVLAR